MTEASIAPGSPAAEENVAFVAIDKGRAEDAARLLGAASAMRDASGAAMAFDEIPELEDHLDRLRGIMPPPSFDAAWAAGRAMTQADAVALVVGD